MAFPPIMRPTFTEPIPTLEQWPAGHVIRTERLVLRTVKEDSAIPAHEAIMESIAALGRWLPWAKEDRTFDDTVTWCRKAEADFALRTNCALQAWLIEDGSFVGGMGLHPRDPRVPCFEIGFWCRGKQTGKGFVTEAVRGIAATAFMALGIHRLEIRTDPENVLAAAVARRARFKPEATRRRSTVDGEGKPRDEAIYVLFADDDAVKHLPHVHFGPE